MRMVLGISVLINALIAAQAFTESTADIREFTYPCTLDGPYSHLDGGSQPGTLIDSSGRTLEFVFNRSIGIDAGLPHRLYFGGHTWKTGRLVERGSEEEDAFVYLLLIWAYNNLRNESRVAYDEFKHRKNLTPHDYRQFQAGFPENEIRAMAVLGLVDSIRHEEDRVKAMW